MIALREEASSHSHLQGAGDRCKHCWVSCNQLLADITSHRTKQRCAPTMQRPTQTSSRRGKRGRASVASVRHSVKAERCSACKVILPSFTASQRVKNRGAVNATGQFGSVLSTTGALQLARSVSGKLNDANNKQGIGDSSSHRHSLTL